MIHLLFIVPYPALRESVDYVLSNYPKKDLPTVDVQVLPVEDLHKLPQLRCDAIIARGYTAQRITVMYPEIPVIRLAISGYDMVRAVSECVETYHPKKLAIFSADGQMYEVKDVCRLFQVNAEIYTFVKHDHLKSTVRKAMAAGCDALIGGYSAFMISRELGLPSVVIRTGEDTVQQSIDTAIRTVKQIRHEQVTTQMYKTIIYSSKDGLLYVDASGTIRVQNQVVGQMNGDSNLLGRPLRQALPYLDKLFCEVVSSGQEVSERILTIPGTKTAVSVRCSPVVANQEISGVVINLTDITRIQHLEGQIRRKLSERGLQAKYTFPDIIHQSDTIRQTIERAQRYAQSNSNVIIVGETGTGKELFAQSIHNSSKRKSGPFVAINCAALAENLLESELFGYVEGAFTGTSKGGKMGLFEQAHGGTLFLDEVGEISLSTQSKLLRVLQERQVRRIGDNKVIDVDVRIISATNKSITRLAEHGKFRRDLVYRLDVLRLFVPPLRERENDVELLFMHLLKQQSLENQAPVPALASDAVPLLHEYPFAGNIRELKNIVERTSVLKTEGVITRRTLYDALYPQDLDIHSPEENGQEPLSLCERERLRQALEQCDGNRTRAAKLLGMDRSTLWRKLQKYETL